MTIDPRAVLAAGNNADWYEAVFSAHGLRYERQSFGFVGLDEAPPFYSNLTITKSGHIEVVLAKLTTLATKLDSSVGVKDSFCEISADQHGMQTLFEATWIWRASGPTQMPAGWIVIRSAKALAIWEEAWKRFGSPTERRMFPAAMLEREDLLFLGRSRGKEFDAGCIANISEKCVGLSNVFASEPSSEAFAEAADAAASIKSGLPLVGYESGKDLDFALAAGFEVTGQLRILRSISARP